jgi:hypothetical protein
MGNKTVSLILATVATCFAYSSVASAQEWSPLSCYSDEFDSSELNPNWSFVNPAPDPDGQSWSLTSSPGFLTMTTTGPTDIIGSTNTAPRIIEDAPPGDFQIVSRVIAAPDVAYEHAGILVESPTDWVRLVRDSFDNSVKLQSSYGSVWTPYPGSDVVLRLAKKGAVYEGAYSDDGGQTFAVFGEVDGPAEPVGIGMVVASTPPGNVFSAEFDYFRVAIWSPLCGDVDQSDEVDIDDIVYLITYVFASGPAPCHPEK